MRRVVSLKPESEQALKAAIKSYFLNERDEEIGDLQATLLYDFFVEHLAPDFYNQGVKDATVWLRDKLEDMHHLEV